MDFQALAAKRTARARLLAERYPSARGPLRFYGEIASLQQTLSGGSPLAARQPLVELVLAKGPDPLKQTAREINDAKCQQALDAYLNESDTTSPLSFFARVLLQPWVAASPPNPRARGSNRCPHCGHPPQVGCRRPQGDGTALSLVCSLCLTEWPFARGHCPACGLADEKKLVYYAAPELEHLQVQVCESCRKYLHQVNIAKDPAAVPDVDEIAALPLDVWAGEQGFRKLHPNLVGM